MNMQARMLGEPFFGVRMLVGGAVVADQMQLVIVRHGGGPTGLHWKAGLGTVKRLDMALLVTAQHQCVLGRGHLQAHDLGRVYLGLASAARQILRHGLDSANGVPSTPTSGLNPSDVEPLANLMVVESIGREQHDAGAARQAHLRGIRMRQLHQLLALRVVQFNRLCLPPHHLQNARDVC